MWCVIPLAGLCLLRCSMASSLAGLTDLFYSETLWFLGSDRVEALTRLGNPDNALFKFKSNGAPGSMTYHLPYDPSFLLDFRQKWNRLQEHLEAEPYSAEYPDRKRACAVSKVVVTYDAVLCDRITVVFYCCSYSHYCHFISRIPARTWC